jgi:hypothetical protein
MKKIPLKYLLVIFFTSFCLLGCGGSNNDPVIDPVIPNQDIKYDQNLAKSAVVSASSYNPGQGPEKIVDGASIGSSEFYSSINTSPARDKNHVEWISIKLNNKQDINEIDIFPVATEIHEGFPIDFKIQVSDDGSIWKDIVDIKDHPLPTSANPVVIYFEPVQAAYVRLYAEKLRPINNSWTNYKDVFLLRLAEIEVYMRSPQIKSAILKSKIGISGEENKLDVSIQTVQFPDGTKIKAELIKANGSALPETITSEGSVTNNISKMSMNIPATASVGDYKVKVYVIINEKEISALSDIYTISDKSNRIFYVSSFAGNDTNDGLSEATAIKTLTRASELELRPGDQLLLKRGDLWENQKLLLQHSGTPEYPIIVSSYGTGDKPHIKPNYKEFYGIRIVNAAGYEISDIEISDVIGGIVVWEENTYNHQYLKITDCYFHDMTDQGRGVPSNIPDLLYGMGISIAGSDNYGGKTLLSDIFIENCRFDKCDVGIEVIGRDHDEIRRWNEHSHHKISRFAFMNVNIKNCEITRSYRSGGVMLYCITGGKAENVLIDQTGYNGVGMWWGVCAFQVARVSDYIVENCTFQNTIKGTSPDGQGFDWEADNHNVVVRNCKFLNNDGPATLNFGESWPGENDGCVLDGCYIAGNNKISDVNDDYYNRVFGINKSRPANNGIVKNCEIRLRTNSQSYNSFPLVFDESNRVYNADGELIYQGVERSNPILNESFEDLSLWANTASASVSNGAVKIQNGSIIYLKEKQLSNYFSEAHFNFLEEGSAGICFGVSDANSYYLVKTDVKISMRSTLQLCKVINGKIQVLRSVDAFGLRPKTAFTLRVNANGSDIKIYLQGNLLVTYTLNESYSGSTGLYMGDIGECSISKFFAHPI